MPQIALPNDLSNSLQYLDDVELQRLRAAVDAEIDRRKEKASMARTDKAVKPAAPRSAPPRHETTDTLDIPEGKANLIRASFRAGLKPPTIARTFGVSLSLVNRVLRSTEKSRR